MSFRSAQSPLILQIRYEFKEHSDEHSRFTSENLPRLFLTRPTGKLECTAYCVAGACAEDRAQDEGAVTDLLDIGINS